MHVFVLLSSSPSPIYLKYQHLLMVENHIMDREKADADKLYPLNFWGNIWKVLLAIPNFLCARPLLSPHRLSNMVGLTSEGSVNPTYMIA